MPLALTAPARAASQKVHGADAWIIALRVVADVSTVGVTVAHLTDHAEAFSYGGKTYNPCSFVLSDRTSDSEGTIPQVTLTIPNVLRTFSRPFEEGAGFRGQTVTIREFVTSDLTEPWNVETHRIRHGSLSRDALTLLLEMPNPTDATVPADQFARNACRHRYGSRNCGFRITSTTPTPLRRCSKTFAACVERGDYEVSQGFARQHPRLFGGFPTMPSLVRA